MKKRYLKIMDRIVSIYTEERIHNYIKKTTSVGITEHGFPRLCANIGILIAHGRKLEYKKYFEEMMDICCRDLPTFTTQKSKRGNDFSIREIISCILELEMASVYPQEIIAGWKEAFAHFEPKDFYCIVAPYPPVAVNNWAAFNAASEQIRSMAGLSNNYDYIENQIASQMFSFDENGMYRDPNDPMVYDLVTRVLLSACLHYGYNGIYKAELENHLRKAGLLTLKLQSVTGEAAYGGRSNQFLHNEAHLAACLEFEASAHYKAGDAATAGQLKAAANLALSCIEQNLENFQNRHIKNNFPIDSMIGCEDYAYYDKYMVTAASFLYLAYEFCDDSITATSCPAEDDSNYVWATSAAFRKVFSKSGPYFIEAELISDAHYDANGIGRIHRRGAPSSICLATPASQNPNYKLQDPNAMPVSICCGAKAFDGWHFTTEDGGHYKLQNTGIESESSFNLIGLLQNGQEICMSVDSSVNGVDITVKGHGLVGLIFPAFHFDGENNTTISVKDHSLSVGYKGWRCDYVATGNVIDLNCICANRNGKYKMYRAEAQNELKVHIEIKMM